MITKVIKLNDNSIEFNNGIVLSSDHESDCCEHHYLSFKDLDLKDFKDLEFNLNDDNFFERLSGYGIALKPIKGFPVRVPGYGDNNGYYSSNLSLLLEKDHKLIKKYDITECQDY